MRSANIAGGETIFSGDINGLRGDAQGSATLSAHQMLGSLAAATNPTDGQTLTLTINGTAIAVRFKNTIAAANDVKIQGSATLTAAALYTFLTNPQLTTVNQIAATAANQALLSYLWFNNVTTTTYIGSMNKTVNSQLTSLTVATTVTSAVWTGNTLKLFVQGGTVYVAGTKVNFAGGMTPAVAAPASNPRIDVLTIDSSGTLAWTTGAENASPVVPTYPINKVPIVELWNVVGETILEDNDNQVSGQGFVNFDVRPMVGTSFNPAAITQTMLPATDATYDLGSATFEFNNIYAKTGIFVNGAPIASKAYGGTGTDGALSITSGTTTIALGTVSYLEKNYTTISITSTGNLAFSGANNTTGTIVALRTTGNVTITTNSTHAIDVRLLGGGLSNGVVLEDSPASSGSGTGGAGGGSCAGRGTGGGVSHQGASGNNYMTVAGPAGPSLNPFTRYPSPGGSGSSGTSGGANGFSGASPGGGGLGGGGLYIECGAAYNFTTGAIDASGQAGSTGFSGGGGATTGGCGGGGGGGAILILYATLTADTGTYNVTAGAGGSGTGAGGSAGTNGASFRGVNHHFA